MSFSRFPIICQLAYYLQRLDRNCEYDSAVLEAKSDGCSYSSCSFQGWSLNGRKPIGEPLAPGMQLSAWLNILSLSRKHRLSDAFCSHLEKTHAWHRGKANLTKIKGLINLLWTIRGHSRPWRHKSYRWELLGKVVSVVWLEMFCCSVIAEFRICLEGKWPKDRLAVGKNLEQCTPLFLCPGWRNGLSGVAPCFLGHG